MPTSGLSRGVKASEEETNAFGDIPRGQCHRDSRERALVNKDQAVLEGCHDCAYEGPSGG